MKRSRRGIALLAAAIAVMTGAMVAPNLGVASSTTAENRLTRHIQRLRQVTGAYHNEALAVAGGFERTDQCVASPDGGMGYHYVNGGRFDATVNKDQPEVLLYAPGPEGTRRLTGVEYLKVDADQDLSTDDDRPVLFGHPFAGPMPGHGPGMPIHYDLHVWVWRWNPSGTFAEWNPRVTCPQ